MEIICSACDAPMPVKAADAPLNAHPCSCGVVGSWRQAPSSSETLEGELRGACLRALKDGVAVSAVADVVTRVNREFGAS